MRKTATPLVSTCHTWYDDNPLLWLYGAIDRRVLRHFAAVVSVSDEVTERLLKSGVAPDRVHFIRNGIDLRPFANATPSLRHLAEPDGLLVGWIGRLTHDKGPDVFLRAIAQVRPQVPTARYILVGEGPYRPELERLLADLAIGDIVHLLGQRHDMPNVYASCDLLVSSSRKEGLPMAILEGMAANRPWIATTVGAVPMAIRDGQTGLLLPPDHPDLLAAAMSRLLGHPEERDCLATAARGQAQSDFSAQRMSKDYLSLYDGSIR
jgi:glycosyltransferase involved in cell wall biosynthesis